MHVRQVEGGTPEKSFMGTNGEMEGVVPPLRGLQSDGKTKTNAGNNQRTSQDDVSREVEGRTPGAHLLYGIGTTLIGDLWG